MDIYTAHYRYSGNDRLDITVKGSKIPGDVFAPTWDIVKDFQDQKINEWEYTQKYMGLLASRWYITPKRMNDSITAMVEHRTSLTLVCFCKPQTFCHRILAARILEGIGLGKYHGERILKGGIMNEIFVPLGVLLVLMFLCQKHVSMFISHILNIIFRLPHPGPNDIQGSCWCRRHEGPHKYTFRDYIYHLIN